MWAPPAIGSSSYRFLYSFKRISCEIFQTPEAMNMALSVLVSTIKTLRNMICIKREPAMYV